LDWVFGGKMKSTCSRNAAEEAFRNQHGHDYTFSSPNQKATQKYKYPLFSLTKLHMIAFLENLLRRAEKKKKTSPPSMFHTMLSCKSGNGALSALTLGIHIGYCNSFMDKARVL